MTTQTLTHPGVNGHADASRGQELLPQQDACQVETGAGAETDGQAAGRVQLQATPILVSTPAAAAMCGVSAATWARLLAKGAIGPQPVRLGGRVLWSVAELQRWAESRCPARAEWIARSTRQLAAC